MISVGDQIDKYRIEEQIGRGAAGAVFRARDVFLDVDVCLKFLHSQFAKDPAALERFKRELLSARKISHPGVCKSFDLGTHKDQYYLVMEYVAGESLANILNRGAISVTRALNIMRDTADALAAAHRVDVIHRDIKPGNIIIGDDDKVTLVDFGVASNNEGESLTRPGMMVGSLSYIAPEVWAGAKADKQSDIWGLGVVFYGCVTGTLPYKSQNFADLYKTIMKTTPKRPQSINEEVSDAVEEIIFTAMCIDTDKRYQSAQVLKEAISLLIKPAPVALESEKNSEKAQALFGKTSTTKAQQREEKASAEDESEDEFIEAKTEVRDLTDTEVPDDVPDDEVRDEEGNTTHGQIHTQSLNTQITQLGEAISDNTELNVSSINDAETKIEPTQIVALEDADITTMKVHRDEFPDRSSSKKKLYGVAALVAVLFIIGAILFWPDSTPDPVVEVASSKKRAEVDEPTRDEVVAEEVVAEEVADEEVAAEEVAAEEVAAEEVAAEEVAAEEVVAEEVVVKLANDKANAVKARDTVRAPKVSKRNTSSKNAADRRVYLAKRKAAFAEQRARGFRFGDVRAADRLLSAAAKDAKRGRYQSATKQSERAKLLYQGQPLDDAFVNAKLVRFNKAFERSKNEQAKARVKPLIPEIFRATQSVQRNAALNRAFDALR